MTIAQPQLQLSDPEPRSWAGIRKSLPRELTRACGAMACGDGWKSFLTERLGKWALQETPLSEHQKDSGYQTVVSHEEFYELAVEYGYSRLAGFFNKQTSGE